MQYILTVAQNGYIISPEARGDFPSISNAYVATSAEELLNIFKMLATTDKLHPQETVAPAAPRVVTPNTLSGSIGKIFPFGT